MFACTHTHARTHARTHAHTHTQYIVCVAFTCIVTDTTHVLFIAKLMLTDPTLAMRCYFGPAVAYQFRLQGPGTWPGAREAVLATSERIAYPLSKKRAEQLAKKRLNSGCGRFLKVLSALLVLAAVCVMWFR